MLGFLLQDSPAVSAVSPAPVVQPELVPEPVAQLVQPGLAELESAVPELAVAVVPVESVPVLDQAADLAVPELVPEPVVRLAPLVLPVPERPVRRQLVRSTKSQCSPSRLSSPYHLTHRARY